MIEVPRGVIVAESATAGRWSIHSQHGTEHLLQTSDVDADAAGMELAERLASVCGGIAVRCVVLVSDDEQRHEPRVMAAYPRHVHAITHRVALAHAVTFDAPRFVVIVDGEVPMAALMIRTRAGLLEQSITWRSMASVIETATALGVEHFAFKPREAGGVPVDALRAMLAQSATLEVLGAQAHIAGAARYAAGLASRDGVWEDSSGASRLNARRSVSYTIHRTARAIFDEADSTLASVVGDRPVLLAVDRNVHTMHGEAIADYSRRRLNVRGTILVSPLESDKEWRQVERICQTATNIGLDRRAIIVAIGGGVTLDLAGLAAAVFRRGVGYVRVATTLVGQIDVSLGLKQAVNACGRKNLVGAFYAPIASINDYNFLRTLPPREVACGLAEVVKIALVRDERLFEDVERIGAQLVGQPAKCVSRDARDMWYRAECLMLEELSSNLFESSLERLVDFGHTFSPTIEASSDYRIAHGQAVALDMLLSTFIAVRHGICDPLLFPRLAELIRSLSLSVWSPDLFPVDRLQLGLASTRLHRGGRLNLVVPVAAGRATLVQAVSDDDLACGVEAIRALMCDRPQLQTDAGVA